MWSARLLMVLAGMLIGASTTAPAQDANAAGLDPLVYVRSDQPPQFRALLSREQYQGRLKESLAALGDPQRIAATDAHENGYFVVAIAPNSQALQLSLHFGDVIDEVDHKPVEPGDFNDLRGNGDQTASVHGVKGNRRELIIHAGPIGMSVVPTFRPELFYLRKGQRNVNWDTAALAGAAFCQSDPDLAEMAWHEAIDKGYQPDALSDCCGALLAWRQARVRVALEFLRRAEARGKAPRELGIRYWVRAIAVADFKLEQALARKLVPNPSPQFVLDDGDGYLRELIGIHNDLTEMQRARPAPSVMADKGPRVNLLNAIEAAPDQNNARYLRQINLLLGRRSDNVFRVSASPDFFYSLIERPTDEARNVELKVRVSTRSEDDKPSVAPRSFAAGLLDGDNEELFRTRTPATPHLLQVRVNPWGRVEVYAGVRQSVQLLNLYLPESVGNVRQYWIRLIQANGCQEVWLNHQRLLYIPAGANPHRIGFSLHAVGTTNRVHVEFSKIGSQ